jgi:hypothetical protein
MHLSSALGARSCAPGRQAYGRLGVRASRSGRWVPRDSLDHRRAALAASVPRPGPVQVEQKRSIVEKRKPCSLLPRSRWLIRDDHIAVDPVGQPRNLPPVAHVDTVLKLAMGTELHLYARKLGLWLAANEMPAPEKVGITRGLRCASEPVE